MAALTGAAGVMLAMLANSGTSRPAAGVLERPAIPDMYVPEFQLINQLGEPVTHERLEGRVSVLDFIFTDCPLICPLMTHQMSRVARALEGTAVQFVSISVDPERDTPEVLRQYADRYGADGRRWLFLTGPREAIWSMVRDGLSFAIGEDESQPIRRRDGSEGAMIVHPSRLLLVGPDRRIVGMYDYQSEAQVQQLIDDARTLVRGR